MRCEYGDVALPLAQGRHLDLDDLQAEIEVLSEPPLTHPLLQWAVRGGDHARPGRSWPFGADRIVFTLLQHPQHFGLQIRTHVTDLVEEHGTLAGQLEVAPVSSHSARERAAYVPE